MDLHQSPKIYKNYKCDKPENTVKKLEDGFNQLDFVLRYDETKISTLHMSTYFSTLLEENLGSASHGKGTTSLLTQAGAYAEMAERFSAGFFSFYTIEDGEKYSQFVKDILEHNYLNGFKKLSDSDIFSYDFVNKNYFQKPISEQEYKTLNEQKLFNVLVDAYSFVYGENKKVPVKFFVMMSGSTGLASGNTVEEAITQAACENFERYAAAHIVTNHMKCPTIDESSIENSEVHRYIEMLSDLNFEVIIKDFTLKNSMPVVGFLLKNKNIEKDDNDFKTKRRYMRVHAGSHVDIEHAILRCFTECFQGLSKEEFMYGSDLEDVYNFWTKKINKPYISKKDDYKYFFKMYECCDDLSFLLEGEKISIDSLKTYQHKDALDDCNSLVDICKRNGLDMQVIDYTHPVLKFPVVRVIMPPISTDSDPFLRKFLPIKEYEKRFNFFYGIKDFYYFVTNNDWTADKEKLQNLITNIESFLSTDLSSYKFFFNRGFFNQIINLFHILAFSHLSVGNFEESLKYMQFLKNHKDKSIYFSEFYNNLLNPASNSSAYSNFINKIKKEIKNPGSMKPYVFPKNPFKPSAIPEEVDVLFKNLLKKINDSFSAGFKQK